MNLVVKGKILSKFIIEVLFCNVVILPASAKLVVFCTVLLAYVSGNDPCKLVKFEFVIVTRLSTEFTRLVITRPNDSCKLALFAKTASFKLDKVA